MAEKYADVLVVGSGPAGATYARVLLDALPECRVLLVDAGPRTTDPPGVHVNTVEDGAIRAAAQVAAQGPAAAPYPILGQEELDLAYSRGKELFTHPGLFLLAAAQRRAPAFPAAAMTDSVGGMASYWYGCCPRPADAERIQGIERAQFDRALAVADRFLGVATDQFSVSEEARRLEAMLSGLFDSGRPDDRRVQPMPLAVDRRRRGSGQWGPGVMLEGGADDRPLPVELWSRVHCRRLLVSGGRVDGAELVDLDAGEALRVRARFVVVAADSLRTPQLLFASGIRPWALGRYLNEHPYLAMSVKIDPDGPLGAHDATSGGAIAATVMPASGVTWVPFWPEKFPFHAQLTRRGAELSLGLFLPKDVDPDNRVWFEGKAMDWRDMPVLSIEYRLSVADLERIEMAKDCMAAIGRAAGLERAEYVPRLTAAGSSLHYMGTMHMGAADDGSSVCDLQGRVWGYENLFLAGNGVIPGPTAGNPTIVTVALAVLGAEELVRRLSQ